jgi:5-methylcytosine-specific restriction endonuclease McrA
MPKKPSSTKRNRVMRLLRKYNLIKKAGGKCVICSYKKNLAALAFHHINEKGTRLSGSFLIKMSIKGAEEELSRCVLVCHNCHSEIHNPDLSLKIMAQMCNMINKNLLTQEQAYKQFLDR